MKGKKSLCEEMEGKSKQDLMEWHFIQFFKLACHTETKSPDGFHKGKFDDIYNEYLKKQTPEF